MRHRCWWPRIAAICLLSLSGCGDVKPVTFPTTTTAEQDRYTGTWRGPIGEFVVVMNTQAAIGFGLSFGGDVTFTGASSQGAMRLTGVGGDASRPTVIISFYGVSSRSEGQIRGEMVEGRAIVGQFQGPRDYDGVLGIDNAAVMLVKD